MDSNQQPSPLTNSPEVEVESHADWMPDDASDLTFTRVQRFEAMQFDKGAIHSLRCSCPAIVRLTLQGPHCESGTTRLARHRWKKAKEGASKNE